MELELRSFNEHKIPKKRSKAIYVDDISLNKCEEETLLPPGSKLTINSVQHHGSSVKLDLEVLI